jgi:pimeloyl-ACP methyl ester carboxylesterase/DNA-binding CsgD family transcriptional regulator
LARDLVEQLYETSLEPERLDELIAAWDERIGASDPTRAVELRQLAERDVIPHLARALAILDRITVAEAQRVQAVLAGVESAAIVVGASGIVIAANQPAQVAHGLFPADTISPSSSDPVTLEILDRIDSLLARGPGAETVVSLRSPDTDRLVVLHLRTIEAGRGTRQLLAVSSECIWPERLSALLADAFDLTAAETGVLQAITSGDTVAQIARRARRSQGTVRTQIHALLAKTGARSQVELVRLTNLLLRSLPAGDASGEDDHRRPILRRRPLLLPDGRRADVFVFGDPLGRPVLWLQSTLGVFVPTRSADADLRRRRMRVLVPIRAGFGASDPAPDCTDVHDLAVADTLATLAELELDSALVVAPVDDIRLALMLAHAAPQVVRGIVAVGAGFPIQTFAQYQRLHALGRFFRVCALHTPQALPFAAKAFYAVVRRFGIESMMRKTYAEVAGDARAFADAEVAEALTSGFTYMMMSGSQAEAAFCADLIRLHQDWPRNLGHVQCPVLLVHGEEDRNAPLDTVREYCALYPEWRLVTFPGEGQLLSYARRAEVIDLIEAELTAADPALRTTNPPEPISSDR